MPSRTARKSASSASRARPVRSGASSTTRAAGSGATRVGDPPAQDTPGLVETPMLMEYEQAVSTRVDGSNLTGPGYSGSGESGTDGTPWYDNLMGDGDSSLGDRGGFVLYWEGHGEQGPASEGSGDSGHLDITDVMEVFEMLSATQFKGLKLDAPTMWGSTNKERYAAAKEWKELLQILFEDIPEAAEMTKEDLEQLGLKPEVVDAWEAAKPEAGPSQKTGAEDTLETSEDAATGGSGDAADGPGTATVLQLGVRTQVDASTLPVKLSSGSGEQQTRRYLMEWYADESVRLFEIVDGALEEVPLPFTGVDEATWKTVKERPKEDGVWVLDGWEESVETMGF